MLHCSNRKPQLSKNNQVNIFLLSNICLVSASLFLIFVISKYQSSFLHQIWLYFNLSVFCWGLGALATSLSQSFLISNISYRIGCIGATFIPLFLVHFSFLLNDQKNKYMPLFYASGIFVSLYIGATELIFLNKTCSFYHHFVLPCPGKYFLVWFIHWASFVTLAHIQFIFFCIKHKNQKFLFNYLLYFSILGFTSGSLCFLIPYGNKIALLGNFGVAVYTILLTYAIFKHRLFNFQIVIKKGLFYSILVSMLLIIYLLCIMLVESLFRGLVGYKSFLISLFSASIISVAFNPIRNRIQHILDYLFLGKTVPEIASENLLLKEELEHSERLKAASTLALGLAHEIKNPLTTLKTFSEYLPSKSHDKEFIDKFSRLIPQEVDRINHIVRQLLDFSKPAPLSFKQVSVNCVLKDTCCFFNNDLLKKRIVIKENYDQNIPLINADESQLKQVFINLILNAIEAMPIGGTLSIESRLNETASKVEISISDTGFGIDEEDLKHVFNPFFTKKDSGTGLGLPIAHQIIKNHNGLITLNSKKNMGSILIIQLPIPIN